MLFLREHVNRRAHEYTKLRRRSDNDSDKVAPIKARFHSIYTHACRKTSNTSQAPGLCYKTSATELLPPVCNYIEIRLVLKTRFVLRVLYDTERKKQ